MMKINARWTPEEDAKAVAYYRMGIPLSVIASRMGRSQFSVTGRLHKLRDQGKVVLNRYDRPHHRWSSWTTDQEIDFIRGLGRYSEPGVAVGRRALLIGYVHALLRRDVWDAMDRDVIAKTAYDALLEAALTDDMTAT